MVIRRKTWLGDVASERIAIVITTLPQEEREG